MVVVRAKEIVVATHLIVDRDVHPFHRLHPHRVLVNLKGLSCRLLYHCQESIIVPGVDYCARSRLLCQESIIVPVDSITVQGGDTSLITLNHR